MLGSRGGGIVVERFEYPIVHHLPTPLLERALPPICRYARFDCAGVILRMEEVRAGWECDRSIPTGSHLERLLLPNLFDRDRILDVWPECPHRSATDITSDPCVV